MISLYSRNKDRFFKTSGSDAAVPRNRERTNPFYVLLVAIGMAFTVTACAYFVMALRESGAGGRRVDVAATSDTQGPQSLLDFLNRHGVKLLIIELAILALATCGAIGTDRWWSAGNPQKLAGGRPSEDDKHNQ
jgi:hypothetical protein